MNNTKQVFDEFVIFPKEWFEIGKLYGRYYTIHLNDGLWRKNKFKSHRRVKQLLSYCPFLYDKIQIVVRTIRYNKVNKKLPFYEYSMTQK